MSSAKRTHDHESIKRWVETRGGRPAVVGATNGSNGSGILRIDFGEKEERLDEVTWEQFFEIFDRNNLDFLYQETTGDDADSRFFKFVARE